jgi:hypothetical protein
MIDVDLLKIIGLTITMLIGVPFYLYVLTRWISTAIFRSYFEIKKEIGGK